MLWPTASCLISISALNLWSVCLSMDLRKECALAVPLLPRIHTLRILWIASDCVVRFPLWIYDLYVLVWIWGCEESGLFFVWFTVDSRKKCDVCFSKKNIKCASAGSFLPWIHTLRILLWIEGRNGYASLLDQRRQLFKKEFLIVNFYILQDSNDDNYIWTFCIFR